MKMNFVYKRILITETRETSPFAVFSSAAIIFLMEIFVVLTAKLRRMA